MFKHLFKNLIAGNWKAVGWAALSALGSLLLAIISVIPLAPLGDRKGHVGSNEKPWAVQGQWLSAIAWVSFLPAIVWYLASNTNPYLLWLELPIAIAGSFWLSRRFSAHQGEEQTVRQWLSGLGNLIGDPPRGRFDADEEPPALPFNGWRALSLVGAGVMAVAVLLILLPHWVFLLPYGQSLVSQISEYNAGILLLGYWISVLPSAAAGYKHGKLQSSQANITAVWGPQLASVMSIPFSTWLEYQCTIEWSAAHDELKVAPVPPGTRLKLDGLAARVESILPGWSLKSADSESIVLVTIGSDEREAAARQYRAQSNGMVVAISLGSQGVAQWSLNPDRRPDAAALDAFARTVGMRVLTFDEYRFSATAGKLSASVERIRDGLATLLRNAPQDFDVQVTLTEGAVSGIRIGRYPSVLDSDKRISSYLSAINQLVPVSGAFWDVEDKPADGAMVFTLRADMISGIQEYPWDAPVTHTAIPFARNTSGSIVNLGLLETNQLLGGLPGSGKSGGLTALLAGISRLENVALVGLDPKKVELAGWAARFTRISKTDEYASSLLEAIVGEMDRRYDWLEGRGLKKFTPAELSDTFPLIVIVIDELADLVSVGVTKEEKDAELQRSTAVRRLIAKGRAAGIVVITATQKPQADVIPTALRDLIQQRVAFSCTTIDMTDTILGKGMGGNGGAAHEIEAAAKGVCFIVNESSRVPVRARAFWIPDEEVLGLAESTAHLRMELPWLPLAPTRKTTAGFVVEPETEVRNIGTFEFSLSDLDSDSDVDSSGQESAPAELKPAPAVQGGFVL